MTKVVIIGGGSIRFTRSVLVDLCAFPELQGTISITLHDIDQERLTVSEKMARQIVEHFGAGFEIEATTDRRRALDGARYVINEIQVGGHQATLIDFDIPRRFGLRQTIGDTIGIGGIMRGLRTIPVAIAIGNEMAELCPGATLLNYTNPMAMVPWGIYEGSRFTSVVGLCHSVRDTHRFLAAAIGVAEGDIRFRTGGFNHQGFVYAFEDRYTSEDLYPRLRAVARADPDGLGRRVRFELFDRFGFFPTESSEHSSEYVPWFLHHTDQVEHFRIPLDEYVSRSESSLAEFERLKSASLPIPEMKVGPLRELASDVIHSMETGVVRESYGNVRNGGLIAGLPDDACVEVPVLVDKNGIQPTRLGELPTQCLALNRTFVNVVQLTVRAAIEQRRDHVYQAALLDPNTSANLTTSAIVEMVDDLIEAHGELIPAGIRHS